MNQEREREGEGERGRDIDGDINSSKVMLICIVAVLTE